MMELDENDTRWTDEARESFRTAAANLVEAIRQHSAALLDLTDPDADPDTVSAAIAEAGEHLEAAATSYADTQFELTGTVPPLGLDEDDYTYEDGDLEDGDLEEDEDDEDEDVLDEPDLDEATPVAGEPSRKVTVLHRADFLVTDELAVIQAGKEAQHEVGDESEEPVDVADLGEALQQLQQSGGLDALADAPGLTPAGATTWVLETPDVLADRDPDEWPDSPFTLPDDAPDRLLHRVDELAG